jgi:protease-4
METPLAARRTPKVLELDLTHGLQEAPPASPLAAVRALQTPVLRQVLRALRDAADDPRVVGLVAHVGGTVPTAAQTDEICTGVAEFRAAGKPTWCWAEAFGELGPGNVAYLLATAFDEIWLQPSGDVGLTGVVAEAVFVRGTLDKLGVQPQFGQRHEYKSAADTLMQTGMTEAHRAMVERLAESATDHVLDAVSRGRGLTPSEVRGLVDEAPIDAATARERRLVDRLGYRDEVYAAIEERLGKVTYTFVHRYRRKDVQAFRRRLQRKTPVVGVVHAVGPIHLGRSGRSPLAGRSIGSDSLGAALRAIGDDDDVKAVVLRLDSPGGSYVASDAIRREVLRLRQTGRPVVASMATVAASGGYYIAMPADTVVASPGTITGSIGVLAGKLVTRDALERIGVRRESVSVGRFAEMLSPQRPFTDEEWQRLDSWLDRVYADFVAKAAEDRGTTVEALDDVARGRVWTGLDAHERGLVDELGGLETAIGLAARRAGLDRDEVDVRVLPRPNVLERLRPAENSDHVGAAAGMSWAGVALGSGGTSGVGSIGELETRLLSMLGLSPYGVLSLPVTWRLR